MKNRLSLLLIAIMAVFVFSCDNQEEVITPKQTDNDTAFTPVQQAARNFIGYSIGMQNLYSGTLTSFMRPSTSAGGRYSNPAKNAPYDIRNLIGARILEDETPEDWETCAEFEYYDNEDGSVTWILDYGDGCNEDGEWIAGRVMETYWEGDHTYLSETTFEELSIDGVTLTGTVHYEAAWECPGDDWEYAVIDSEVSEDISIRFEEEDDDHSLHYTSFRKEHTDYLSYTVEEGFFNFITTWGDFYRSEVMDDLVMLFECEESFVYVSGEERILSDEGVFDVNYGDGACDNIIVVTTEDGETFEIDVEEEWEDISDDCGFEDDDYYGDDDEDEDWDLWEEKIVEELVEGGEGCEDEYVAGKVELYYDDELKATVDFGDGTCDDEVTICWIEDDEWECDEVDFEELEEIFEEGEDDEDWDEDEAWDWKVVEELVDGGEDCDDEHVAGVVEIYYYDELVATVDFGDGTCDDEATICWVEGNDDWECEVVDFEELEEIFEDHEDGDHDDDDEGDHDDDDEGDHDDDDEGDTDEDDDEGDTDEDDDEGDTDEDDDEGDTDEDDDEGDTDEDDDEGDTDEDDDEGDTDEDDDEGDTDEDDDEGDTDEDDDEGDTDEDDEDDDEGDDEDDDEGDDDDDDEGDDEDDN